MMPRVFVATAFAALLPLSAAGATPAADTATHRTRAERTTVTLPEGDQRGRVIVDDTVVRRESLAPDARAVPQLRPEKRVRVLVLRSYSRGGPPAHPTVPELKALMKQVAHYYTSTSRGRQKFRFSISPWVKLPASSCHTLLRREPLAAAKRAGFKMSKFNRLMVMQPQCKSFASYGERPGSFTWINFGPDFQTLVHELGHNLGLTHANARLCKEGNRAVMLTGTCRVFEYADAFDPMGNMGATSFSAAALKRLGWNRKIATTTRSGTYRIGDTTAPGTALQALKVVDGKTSYWVEYLRRDATEPEDGLFAHGPGVLVRQDTGGPSLAMLDGSPGSDSMFLDAYSPEDPALNPGSSFTTPAGTRIAVVSADTTAQVRVSRKTKPGAPDAPVVSSMVQQPGGGAFDVQVVPPVDNGEVVLGYEVTFAPRGTTRTVWTPAAFGVFTVESAGGFASATVRAINRIGAGPASAAVVPQRLSVTLDPLPAEVTSPFTGTYRITAGASRVSELGITVEDAEYTFDCQRVLYPPTTGSFTCTASPGANVLRLTVTDEDGAESFVEQSITVR